MSHQKSYTITDFFLCSFQFICKLKRIYIHSVSSDVSVFSTDEEDVKIHFYGSSTAGSEKELPNLITNLEGNKLKIEIKYPKVLFYNANVVLDVYIPQDYTGNINIDTVSADVDMSKVKMTWLTISEKALEVKAAKSLKHLSCLYLSSMQVRSA